MPLRPVEVELIELMMHRFSIGKILDIATQAKGSSDKLFGLDLNQFYLALGAVCTH